MHARARAEQRRDERPRLEPLPVGATDEGRARHRGEPPSSVVELAREGALVRGERLSLHAHLLELPGERLVACLQGLRFVAVDHASSKAPDARGASSPTDITHVAAAGGARAHEPHKGAAHAHATVTVCTCEETLLEVTLMLRPVFSVANCAAVMVI